MGLKTLGPGSQDLACPAVDPVSTPWGETSLMGIWTSFRLTHSPLSGAGTALLAPPAGVRDYCSGPLAPHSS